jgi:hypothetical protein
MKNKTRSRVIIEMNHIDHAVKIEDFFDSARESGLMGGDLTLKYEGAVNGERFIGHDVNILEVRHEIDGG